MVPPVAAITNTGVAAASIAPSNENWTRPATAFHRRQRGS
jgi:hypothetical protein